MKAMWQRLETCDSLWSVGFRLAVATGCLTLAAVVSSSAAYASCATEAMASPRFIGTVISTEKDDRIATVITDSRATGQGDRHTGHQLVLQVIHFRRSQVRGGRALSVPSDQCGIAVSGRQMHRNSPTRWSETPPVGANDRSPPPGCPSTSKQVLSEYLLFFGPVTAAMALIFVGRKAFRRLTTHGPHNGD